jgi:hypothetical protein
MLFLRLAAYVLWIPGGFAIIAAVILPVVGSSLSHRGREAASWPQSGCAQVRPGFGPIHVHGTCAPGPRGMLTGRLSGSECVWYRERVLRRYMVTRIRCINLPPATIYLEYPLKGQRAEITGFATSSHGRPLADLELRHRRRARRQDRSCCAKIQAS